MENDKRDVIDWLNDVANDEQWLLYYSDSEVRLLAKDALSLLKAQKQEIDRLKHCIDCEAAEKLPSGCVGYGRGFNDDEPCETCKSCKKYNGYGEE